MALLSFGQIRHILHIHLAEHLPTAEAGHIHGLSAKKHLNDAVFFGGSGFLYKISRPKLSNDELHIILTMGESSSID